MNKGENNYYIIVAIIFAFLSGVMGWSFLHYYEFLYQNHYNYDKDVTTFYLLLFLIQSGLYVVIYGLGRWLDFSVKPAITFFSFGDFVIIFSFILFGLLWGYRDNDNIWDYLYNERVLFWYIVFLFLSKFLLIFILSLDKTIINWMYKKKTNSHSAV